MKDQGSPKPALQRYFQQFFFVVFMYVVVLIASITLLKNYEFPGVWEIMISISPALPIIFIMLALMRLLMDSDELQQRVHFFAVTFSAALTGLLTFSYGLLENIGFPKMPTFTVFPTLFVH